MATAQAIAKGPAGRGQLLKVLGLSFTIAVGLGAVIGGGILRTPATVMDAVPVVAAALALWVVVGLHSLLEANSVAEVMTTVPRSGGLFVPARAAFGAPGGLLVGWTDWLAWVAASGALAILTAEFLAMIVPSLSGHVAIVGACVLLGLTALNWLGVREGSRAQIVGSAAKAFFLVAIVLLIFLTPAAEVGRPDVPSSATAISVAGVIIAYQTIYGAYAGWTSTSYFAEEDRDPGRNIPRGMFSAILLVIALYLAVSLALNHALSLEQLRQSKLPVADALVAAVGPIGFKVIAGGAVLIVVTCLNAQMMGAPRILYGLASARLFPRIALTVNRGGTPSAALFTTAAAALALTLTGEFETVFRIMAALGMLPILVALAALFKLRRTAPDLPRPYRAKLYPWLPALVLLLDVGLLIAFLLSDWMSGLFIVGAVAIALPIGLMMRRSHGVESFGQDAVPSDPENCL